MEEIAKHITINSSHAAEIPAAIIKRMIFLFPDCSITIRLFLRRTLQR